MENKKKRIFKKNHMKGVNESMEKTILQMD